jgi:hypothetical protein
MDGNQMLAALRQAADEWDMSPPGSDAQGRAAAAVVIWAQSLDCLLSGKLPEEWQNPEASYWQGYTAAKENLRAILAQVAQVDEELRLAAVLAWLERGNSGTESVTR